MGEVFIEGEKKEDVLEPTVMAHIALLLGAADQPIQRTQRPVSDTIHLLVRTRGDSA